jgi:hypothetical protein
MEKNNLERKETISFWKNLIFSAFFFALTPAVIIGCLVSLISLKNYSEIEKKVAAKENILLSKNTSGVRVFASLPAVIPSLSGFAEGGDARPEILKQYLDAYHSPLVPFAETIVAEADKNGLDFRLITAIAQQESNLCKIIPPQSYNCWGWGIHSKGSLGFSSFEEGIQTVSQGLKEEYIDKGYESIEDIMSKYTPLSQGSWAFGVNKFMAEMQ